MPIYTIEAPTGQLIKIEGPEGASEQQIIEVAQEYMTSAQRPAAMPEQERGLGENLIGAAETGAALATGATTGALGMIGGTLQGIATEILGGNFGTPEAARRIAESAGQGAQALTRTPRTEAGQEQLEAVTETLEPLGALAPAQQQLSAIGQLSRGAAAPRAPAAIDRASSAVQSLTDRARPDQAADITDNLRSVGAAEVPIETQRAAAAQQLPIDPQLTKGQITRDKMDKRFEEETAKLPEGDAIRERMADQNLILQKNIDTFIDQTGAQLTDVGEVGSAVRGALRKSLAERKKKVNDLYKEARKKGEMSQPVDNTQLRTFFQENESAKKLAPIIDAAESELTRLSSQTAKSRPGITSVEKQQNSISLNNMEKLRTFINKGMGADPTNIKFGSEMKKIIDDITENSGGDVYKQARAERAKISQDFESRALVDKLVNSKRGTDEFAIAMEDVLKKSIISPSAPIDTVQQVKKLLTASKEGKQAWKEIQGGVLRDILDRALANSATNQRGDRILSASGLDKAINNLEKSGKLDLIFNAEKAEQIRTINEVAKLIMTSPPGTVNTSNTATVLAGMLDIAISGTSGIPAPIATTIRAIKNKRADSELRKKIEEHLEPGRK